jgi:hypothetical protein
MPVIFRIPAGTIDFPVLQSAQNGYRAHPVSYSAGTGVSTPRDKADRTITAQRKRFGKLIPDITAQNFQVPQNIHQTIQPHIPEYFGTFIPDYTELRPSVIW